MPVNFFMYLRSFVRPLH